MVNAECNDCGATSYELHLELTVCPYADEVYDKKIPMVLCKICYQSRCEDI